MFGENLRRARMKAGLSLRQLEEKIGRKVSAQAIGKYERGEMQPTPQVLEVMAQALGTGVSFLASSQTIKLGTIEFRENKLIRSKSDEKLVEGTINYQLMRYLRVEELVGTSIKDWDKPRQFPFPIRSIIEAEWAAHRVRDDWNLGNDPIPHLSDFLEERGFKVILVDMPESIAGVTCFVENNLGPKLPVIVTSHRITGERQRFTIAHELGHLLLDIVNPAINIEKACDKFAGAFLMPERVLWETLGKVRKNISIGELLVLKRFLGVSIQALTYRAKDLGIINEYTYRSLYSEFSKRHWLKPPYAEPSPVQTEIPHRFRRLCFRALSEEIIDESFASELLDIPITELRKALEGSGNIN